MNKNEGKGFIKNKKGMATILATGALVVGSFAFFTDEAANDFSGQMDTLGITSEFTADEANEDLNAILPGDVVKHTLTTTLSEGQDTAKVRHRLVLTKANEELLREGNLTLTIGGEDVAVDGTETISSIKTVEPGETLSEEIVLTFADTNLNASKLSNFKIDIVTEAIQDRNTEEGDFERVGVQEFKLHESLPTAP